MPRFSVRNAVVLVNVCLLTVLFIHLKTVLWDKNPGRAINGAGSLFGDLADDDDGYDGGNADDRDAVLGLNGVNSNAEWASSEGKTLQVNGGSKNGLKQRSTAVVVASQANEDASWIAKSFPAWEQNIYRVDDSSAKLTVPKNKGRESMVYLTYAPPKLHWRS
jgi:hypothetical protein